MKNLRSKNKKVLDKLIQSSKYLVVLHAQLWKAEQNIWMSTKKYSVGEEKGDGLIRRGAEEEQEKTVKIKIKENI